MLMEAGESTACGADGWLYRIGSLILFILLNLILILILIPSSLWRHILLELDLEPFVQNNELETASAHTMAFDQERHFVRRSSAYLGLYSSGATDQDRSGVIVRVGVSPPTLCAYFSWTRFFEDSNIGG